MAWNAVYMFLFAELYDVPRLRMGAIDQLLWSIHEAYDKYPFCRIFTNDTISDAYQGTKTESILRKLLVQGFCGWAHDKSPGYVRNISYVALEQEELDCNRAVLLSLPEELKNDVFLTYAYSRPSFPKDENAIIARHPCDFHDHKDEQVRQQCEGSSVKLNGKSWMNARAKIISH
ncbi:hypothetical protein BDV96DRAFT_403071 [Lophiotrema nucula]|uniref:Uncharacterized protein n=1 Tax=Lophiotrema nucula TaxID=690887 RepID=A0A6A5ZFA6_9PLEO|nr:hypothetical protein BDV96DRAFT_403071 [Lophiotrema nucula]